MSVVRSDIGIEKVYRIFSKYIVDKIINTNITPNNLSWLSFLLIVVSMPFIIFKENNYFNLISFILINLSLIFDCADGDLAVKKKLQSSFGAHLDCTLDRLADNFFILAIIFANYINGNNVYFSMIVFLPNFDQNNLSKSVLFKFVEFFIFTRTNMLFWGSCFIILSLHKEYLLLMGVYTLVYYFAILIYTYLKSYKK